MYSIAIPLEQGLRPHNNGVHSIAHYSIAIPLEQGLRRLGCQPREPRLILSLFH